MLQPLVVDKIVSYLGEQESPLFASVMLSHADKLARPLEMVRPHQVSRDVEIRGRPVRDLVGIFPAAHATRIPVFLDCRDLGHPLRLVAAQQGRQPLSAFLQQVGLHLEDHATLTVSGSVVADVAHQYLVLRAKDVVRLSRRAPLNDDSDESLHDAGCNLVSSSAAGSAVGRRTHSSRFPSLAGQTGDTTRSGATAASDCRPCSRPHAQTACLADLGSCDAVNMWNLGPVQHALTSRLPGDTSARCVEAVWSPSAEFCRLELEYRLAMSALTLPLIVYDAGDAPVRDYFV